MRKMRVVWSAIALTIAVSASAQISITQSSIAPVGTAWTTYSTIMNTVEFNVGSAGPNQTWTFDEYAFDSEAPGEVVNPAGTPYAADFPTANHALTSDGTAYTYYRLTPSAAYFLGMASADAATVFDPEAYLMPFPCSYNSQWTTVIHSVMEYEQLIIESTDSILNVADGWGTIQTQFGSASVLRVFGHTYSRLETNFTPPTESEYLGYIWYSANGLDVASVISDDGETNPNFTTGFMEMSTVPQAAEPLRGPVASEFYVGQNYPNPFNPSTTLPMELSKPVHVTLSVYDATGRLTMQEEMDLSAGHHQLAVNGSDWSSGVYWARISAGADQRTVKMHLIK
ncbi:MAG: T9SS type A sorting domain-containing protein [Calditrichota bacterium]